MEFSTLPVRHQARAIIVNQRGEVLLVKHIDTEPANPDQPGVLEYWVAPGGGIEPGESMIEAAIRETEEETGVSGLVHVSHCFTIRKPLRYGDQMKMMVADYELFRCEGSLELRLPLRGENIFDVRWWKVEETESSGEIFKPDGLIEQLQGILKRF